MKIAGIKFQTVVFIVCFFPAIVFATQMSSPVSRCKSNMRSLATVLEAYHIDNGSYPPSVGEQDELPITLLTSPIAYVIEADDEIDEKLYFDYLKKYRIVHRTNWVRYGIVNYGDWIFFLSVSLLVVMIFILKNTENKRYQIMLELIMYVLVVFIFFALSAGWGLIDEYKSVKVYQEPESWKSDYLFYHYATDGSTWWVIQSVGPNGVRELENLSEHTKLFSSIAEQGCIPDELLPYTYDPTNGAISAGDIWRVKE